MKLRTLSILLAMLFLGGLATSLTACSEEEPPPMENAPTNPDYNKKGGG